MNRCWTALFFLVSPVCVSARAYSDPLVPTYALLLPVGSSFHNRPPFAAAAVEHDLAPARFARGMTS